MVLPVAQKTPCTPCIYQRRRPEKSALYKAISENWPHFMDDFEGVIGQWTKKTFGKFLECGLLDYGFARAHCTDCDHDFLVAFSCQLRGICPSCAAKRFEVFSRFALDEVIGQVSQNEVAHRQVVFTIPWALRGHFHKASTRNLFFRAMNETLVTFFQTSLGLKKARPGIIGILQTFGDRLNFNPHLHCLVSQGAFIGQTFYPLDIKTRDCKGLEAIFADKIFDFLIEEGLVSKTQKANWRNWQHTGFSVDASVYLPPGQKNQTLRVLRYMARPPIANERIQYDDGTGQVTIRSSKKTAGTRKIIDQIDAFEFLKRMTQHIPPKGTHLIRYFGAYASRTRSVTQEDPDESQDQPSQSNPNRKAWAQMIRQVFEVNPLTCPYCKKEMKIIAFVRKEQSKVINRMLDSLGIERQDNGPRGPPNWLQAQRATQYIQENQDLYPDEFNQDYEDFETTLLDPA